MPAPKLHIPERRLLVSEAEWKTRVGLALSAAVSKGLGAQLVWPGLLRRLERRFPGDDS